jgi:ParB-like chromosome segregation protein Spo0J
MISRDDYDRLAAEMRSMTEAHGQALADWQRGDLSDAAYRILVRRNNHRAREIQNALKGHAPLFPPLRWQERPGSVTYTSHPMADIFPLIEGVAFAELCVDIQQHGQQQPIVVHEGLILDGRNRLKACLQLGISPTFVEFDCLGVTGSIEDYIWSVNLQRRHLTPDQRAAIALKWKEQLAAQAKQRQSAAGGDKKSQKPNEPPLVDVRPQAVEVLPPPPPDEPIPANQTETTTERFARVIRETAPVRPKRQDTTRQKMAKQADVSERKIKQADQVATARPDLVPHVASGKITLAEAARIAHPKVEQPRQDVDAAVKDDMRKFGAMVKARLAALRKDCHRSYLSALDAQLRKFFEDTNKK